MRFLLWCMHVMIALCAVWGEVPENCLPAPRIFFIEVFGLASGRWLPCIRYPVGSHSDAKRNLTGYLMELKGIPNAV